MIEALAVLGGYLLGSMPFGYWLPRVLRGEDIRQRGSGNIGASNVFRVYGRRIGIAVALLGRNHPWGIAVAALIFGYLNQQASPLGVTADISTEIIAVTQGVVVLSVVIAYEVVRRYRVRAEQAEVARQLRRERGAQAVSP